jgi:inhibitor of KinA
MISIVPLGDQAALAYFADEMSALQFASAMRGANHPWVVDIVQAYASVAVFYDLDSASFHIAADEMEKAGANALKSHQQFQVKRHTIPCCYALELDLKRVAAKTGLDGEGLIELHSQTEYTVYAIGFCPGFPYLGYLPPALCGVPRLQSPRQRVEAGSVGLAGRQTGIYTESRPGGWNIIGRTPLELVNVEEEYFPIRTGDRVKFEPIGEAEYRQFLGKRLKNYH